MAPSVFLENFSEVRFYSGLQCNVGLYCFLNQNLVYNNYKPMSYTILNLSLQLKLHFVCSLPTLCQFADRLSHLGQNHVNEKVMKIATFTFSGFREIIYINIREIIHLPKWLRILAKYFSIIFFCIKPHCDTTTRILVLSL